VCLAIFVKDRTGEDKASKYAELDGFVGPSPYTVNARSDVKESSAEPSEAHQREELEVVDKGWECISMLGS
jgi:hypothetical protein